MTTETRLKYNQRVACVLTIDASDTLLAALDGATCTAVVREGIGDGVWQKLGTGSFSSTTKKATLSLSTTALKYGTRYQFKVWANYYYEANPRDVLFPSSLVNAHWLVMV